MSSALSGLGTSSQTQQANQNANTTSQTNPYGLTQGPLSSLISEINNANNGEFSGNGLPYGLPSADVANYQQAMGNVSQMPNFGPAAAQTASNILQTGGDPTGILRSEAANLNPAAQMGRGDMSGLDPTQTPGMANVLKTIQNDVQNSVNSQFAGAGRSLSGLNQQTLARGLSQGEAVPLLNQYNQNFSNMLGANSQLGNVQSGAMGNIGQAFNFANAAPGLAAQGPLTQEAIQQQMLSQPFNYIQNAENLINPIAGLGGTVTGTQTANTQGSGTATNSALSQLGQGLGLLNPLGSFLGSL